MIKAPIKPPTTQKVLNKVTCSFKKKCDNTITSKGVSIPIAANSATGIRCRLKNASVLLKSKSKPRKI
jgi:hypothetical protein